VGRLPRGRGIARQIPLGAPSVTSCGARGAGRTVLKQEVCRGRAPAEQCDRLARETLDGSTKAAVSKAAAQGVPVHDARRTPSTTNRHVRRSPTRARATSSSTLPAWRRAGPPWARGPSRPPSWMVARESRPPLCLWRRPRTRRNGTADQAAGRREEGLPGRAESSGERRGGGMEPIAHDGGAASAITRHSALSSRVSVAESPRPAMRRSSTKPPIAIVVLGMRAIASLKVFWRVADPQLDLEPRQIRGVDAPACSARRLRALEGRGVVAQRARRRRGPDHGIGCRPELAGLQVSPRRGPMLRGLRPRPGLSQQVRGVLVDALRPARSSSSCP